MRDNLLLRKGVLYYGHDDLRISRSAPLERRSKQKTAGRTRDRVHPFGSVVHHPIMDPMRDAPVEQRGKLRMDFFREIGAIQDAR